MSFLSKVFAPGNFGNKPPDIDFIFMIRGGASDVYTSVYNLYLLEKMCGHPLMDHKPFLFGDSAGAFVAAGLAAPSALSPGKPCLNASDLPGLFRANIRDYLSPRRDDARRKLEEDIGSATVSQSITPICISSCEITPKLKRVYFRHIPPHHFGHAQKYIPNLNDGIRLSDAALASSAYPIKFGDHSIPETGKRYIDVAFSETHTNNLLELARLYQTHLKDRRLVCVILGNTYKSMTLAPQENLGLSGVKRHFPDALRALVHMDLVEHATTIFGADNVFDLSLRIEQSFQQKNVVKLPDAFHYYAYSINKRIEWTESQIDTNADHQAKLQAVTALLKSAHHPTALRQQPSPKPPNFPLAESTPQ